MKRANPEKNCFLEYDRLYIDHKIYVSSIIKEEMFEMRTRTFFFSPKVYNDVMGQERFSGANSMFPQRAPIV